jgi:hypothetical protein
MMRRNITQPLTQKRCFLLRFLRYFCFPLHIDKRIIRDFQKRNYPRNSGVGRKTRPVNRTGANPIPQEKIGYFLIWKSLILIGHE